VRLQELSQICEVQSRAPNATIERTVNYRLKFLGVSQKNFKKVFFATAARNDEGRVLSPFWRMPDDGCTVAEPPGPGETNFRPDTGTRQAGRHRQLNLQNRLHQLQSDSSRVTRTRPIRTRSLAALAQLHGYH